MTVKTNRFIFYFVIAVAVLIALLLWHKSKQPTKTLAAAVEANSVPPPAVAAVAVSAPIHTNIPTAQVPSNASVPTPPLKGKEQQMREGLAESNDVNIEFYGRLVDQFGNGVASAQIKFEVPFNNGHAVGVNRGTTMADANGFFTIRGYKGERLSAVPVKSGYALASLNGGGVYSYLWPESQRVHPDPGNPVLIMMWKLQGAEPLVGINKEYKLPYTDKPINFDLIAGNIVPSGGDLKITVNRPDGTISQQHPQNWSIALEIVDGGFIVTPDKELLITYFAPDQGYQPSGTFGNNNGPDTIDQVFFVKSRNGQVYSKLGLSFRINNTPDGFMYIRFGGVANANGSRNWEGDSNTLKAAGQ
jgi:hypothetical protein